MLFRSQELLYINESNLYQLIMRSKLKTTERFQDWVEGEVLPALRLTGRYDVAPENVAPKTKDEILAEYANAQQIIDMVEAELAKSLRL